MSFFSIDLKIQAILLLSCIFFVIWLFAGKILIKIVSIVPCFFRMLFYFIYLFLDIIVVFLHKKIGPYLFDFDNWMAETGRKIDGFLQQWHKRWRYPKKIFNDAFIVIYCVILGGIIISFRTDGMLAQAYTEVTDKFVTKLETSEWFKKETKEGSDKNSSEVMKMGYKPRSIVMFVATINDPLNIRDIPSMKDCQLIDSVDKGSTVIWTGDMAFGIGDSDAIEPWVKVITVNGVSGWARLKYLHPEDENDFELTLWIE